VDVAGSRADDRRVHGGDPAGEFLKMYDELERARRIFDSVCNGITICDATMPEMPLVYVNRAFERMTGYRSEEALGRNCRFLQGRETNQPGLDRIREAIREERDVRVLLRNYRKDGTLFWNELYLSPLLNHRGELTHFVGIQNDATVQVESQMQLKHLAHHDALTGLANRGLLMEELQRAMDRARRNGRRVAVLYLDLDKFKEVNDTFGHEAGDELLKAVAQRLRTAMRAGEMAARLGGDEFIAVLEEDAAGDWRPSDAIGRFVSRISEPIFMNDTRLMPSASVGMALYPQDGDTPEALLKAADFNMYVAKQETRNAQQAEGEGPANKIARVRRCGAESRVARVR
jgi:diguanylate cyclase (GGDEF)-like protein/PAS domain S-box-containing protein